MIAALAIPAPRPLLALPAPRPNPDDIEATFREFIRTNVARADAAPATVELYLREARAFRQYLGDRDLELRDVRSREIREWVRWLVEAGRTPGTIATKIVAVRRMFAAAVDAGMMLANPAEGVQGPKERRETGAAAQRTLDVDEVKALLAAAPGERDVAVRDRALLALLVGHGLRTVEVERLNVADVDLAGRTLLAKGKTRDRTASSAGTLPIGFGRCSSAAARSRSTTPSSSRAGATRSPAKGSGSAGAASGSSSIAPMPWPDYSSAGSTPAADSAGAPRRRESQRPGARGEGADRARSAGHQRYAGDLARRRDRARVARRRACRRAHDDALPRTQAPARKQQCARAAGGVLGELPQDS